MFALAECLNGALVRSILSSGILLAITSILSTASEPAETVTSAREPQTHEHRRVATLAAHAIGALSWRGSSKALRQLVCSQLISARTSEAMICACAAHPSSIALRVATIRALGEISAPPPTAEAEMSAVQHQRWRVRGLFPQSDIHPSLTPKPSLPHLS